MKKVNRILIAGTKSGCGKTTITCGILKCLINKGLKVASFKCGPDYIDPMFHSKVLGAGAGNLDGFFAKPEVLEHLLINNSKDMDISVLEGVMGYYDGIGFGMEGSTCSLAKATKTPVILIMDAKGMGCSLKAVLKGFLTLIPDSNIKGVIFNQLPVSLYEEAKDMVTEYGLKFLGYVPYIPKAYIESRHLGLMTAGEIEDIKEKIENISCIIKETIDLEGIISLSKEAEELDTVYTPLNLKKYSVRIGVAMDEAFCFHYRDNIELLESLGAEILFFSPLRDKKLPKKIDGLILNGGYPELYAKTLSDNLSLMKELKGVIEGGMPLIAECGGFMYLHEALEDMEGKDYRMVGLFKGRCYKTGSLKRFGYINMKAKENNLLADKGGEIKAHEFHYWDSEDSGGSFHAVKASGKKEWDCVFATDRMYAGFPHLYFYQNPVIAENFLKKCLEYKSAK